MSLCPVCGAYFCDHTPEERGQTHEEIIRPLTKKEFEEWEESGGLSRYNPKKIAVAKKYQHYVLTEEDKREMDEEFKEMGERGKGCR